MKINYLDYFLLKCINPKQYFQVTEVYNFSQDDLMTEDIFILDCHSEIFVWVGQQVDSKSRLQALTIGEVWLVLLEAINMHYNLVDSVLKTSICIIRKVLGFA